MPDTVLDTTAETPEAIAETTATESVATETAEQATEAVGITVPTAPAVDINMDIAGECAADGACPLTLPVALGVLVVIAIFVVATLLKRRGGGSPAAESAGKKKSAAAKGSGKAVEIYVGNLSYDMTEAQFRREFERFGIVKSARIIGHRNSGKSKGYGFIEMPHRKEAMVAIKALHNSDVMGRKLRVNEARNGNRPE